MGVAAAVLPAAVARGAGARSLGKLLADLERAGHPEGDWNTLVITFAAATATVALAFAISWLVVRARVRGSMALDGLTFASHAVPGVVIALSFIFLYLQPPLRSLGLYGTVWIVVLALVTQYVSFASRATNAAVMQIHKELEEAGEVSGASGLRILWQITFPLIRPAFIAAWIWVAAHAVRAFSIPLMLAGRDSRPRRSCSGICGMRNKIYRPLPRWECY